MLNNPELPCPCGIICKTCVQLRNGCKNCFAGGGDGACPIRQCVTNNDINGCWECPEFPCATLANIDEAWRELNIGLIGLIKKVGVDKFSSLALKHIGEHYDYGNLRFKTAENIERFVEGRL